MLEIGSLIDGKYKIIKQIGKGGMSVVYLAVNEKANKLWAIKEVRRDVKKDFEIVRQGLIAETDMLKKLRHPGLPEIVDVIEQEDIFLIVMDYIEGVSLNKLLKEEGAQPQEKVIAWARQLCEVLGYLHTRTPAIIYRDMKPANIMLKPDGTVTLIDFGTAREYEEKKIEDTTCLGTVGYAAPEQFGGMGQTDARTDIYSLGATIYHLVTGNHPGEYPYEIKPICQVNPMLSSGLEQIIETCTRKNPKDRYQSCAELLYALEHYETMDQVHRKRQKKKFGIFLGSLGITIVCFGMSHFGSVLAVEKKSEYYEEQLKSAVTCEDYYTAILTDPARTEGYLGFLDFLTEDRILTREEGGQLSQLEIGLEWENAGGFVEVTDVFFQLQQNNPYGYQEVCYEIGNAFLFFYDTNVERNRYASAAKWYEKSLDAYPMAQLYCDMAECMELIDQYSSARIRQTDSLYKEYQILWKKIQELKTYSDTCEDVDTRLLIWTQINHIVNEQAVQFLEITSEDDVISLLQNISGEAGNIKNSVIKSEIQILQNSISDTIEKIESVRRGFDDL